MDPATTPGEYLSGPMRSSPRPLYVSRVVGTVGIMSRDVSSGDGSYPWLCARAGMLGGAAEGGRSVDDEKSALRLVAERVLPVGPTPVADWSRPDPTRLIQRFALWS